MMKKNILALAIAMSLTLAACGPQTVQGGNDADTQPESEITAEVSSAEESSAAESSEAADEVSSEEVSIEEEDAGSEESTSTESVLEYTEFKPAEGLSTTYADLDNRAFAYDGKVYKMGEATLQDLIDAGLPFSESELKNADNNVNANYETTRYTVELTDLSTMQFVFVNTSKDSCKERDAVLQTVRWYSLYIPHDDYEASLNESIVKSINETAEKLSFSFPLNLDKNELIKNSGEPTKQDEYGNVSYTKDSEVYYGSSGYNFSFDKDTNQLKDVSISWLP